MILFIHLEIENVHFRMNISSYYNSLFDGMKIKVKLDIC
jgi:hypothetical protein